MNRLRVLLHTELTDIDRWLWRYAPPAVRTPYRVLRVVGILALILFFILAVLFEVMLLVNDPLIFAGCLVAVGIAGYVLWRFDRVARGRGPDDHGFPGSDGGGCPVPVGTGPKSRRAEAEADWPR